MCPFFPRNDAIELLVAAGVTRNNIVTIPVLYSTKGVMGPNAVNLQIVNGKYLTPSAGLKGLLENQQKIQGIKAVVGAGFLKVDTLDLHLQNGNAHCGTLPVYK